MTSLMPPEAARASGTGMRSCRRVQISCMAVVAVAASLTAAAVIGGTAAAEEPPAGRRKPTAVAVDEQAALAFAREHHPELVKLFRQLERNAPEEYGKAVAELDRNRDRLEKLRARQPERFDAALAEWKLSSRIRLTLARLSLAADPELERELREMVRERAELRLAPLRAEKDRLEKRLDKVARTLADHDGDPVAAIDRELATVTKGLEASRAKARQFAKRSKPVLKAAASSPAAKPAGGD